MRSCDKLQSFGNWQPQFVRLAGSVSDLGWTCARHMSVTEAHQWTPKFYTALFVKRLRKTTRRHALNDTIVCSFSADTSQRNPQGFLNQRGSASWRTSSCRGETKRPYVGTWELCVRWPIRVIFQTLPVRLER